MISLSDDGSKIIHATVNEKVNLLNNYFSNVLNHNTDYEIKDDLNIDLNCTMEPLEIKQDDILKRLSNLNINKSAGYDGIHPRILKETAPYIAYPLFILFTQSLKCGQLPSDWKKANISALHKKGRKNDVSNYRPISITCILSKLFESIIRDSLMKYFMNNKLFSEKQFGFLPGRSTSLQLLNILDDWTQRLEAGGQVDVVYTDLEKAFDKVPHRLLLYKLKKYNVDPQILKWIDSFLVGRVQRVVIDGTGSGWCDVISGISQGFVLGPFLFLVYINDLVKFCQSNNGAIVYLYADDTKIYNYVSCDSDRKVLQETLNLMVSWINDYLLRLNVDKCKHVSYGRNVDNSSEYFIDGHKLETLCSYKDLGVLFDTKLGFNQHIMDKVNKAYSMLGIIKRNFVNLSHFSFLCLYKTMVRSHLEYAVCVWCPCRKELVEIMERVQMRATKLLPGLKNLSYSERLKILKLPTLKYRRMRGDVIEMYKIVHGIYDENVSLKLEYVPYNNFTW